MLVKVWGTITSADSSGFYLNDGSGLTDGTGPKGVKVVGGLVGYQPYVPAAGDVVAVTGISGLATYDAAYGLASTIRLASPGDLTVIQANGPPNGVEVQTTGEDSAGLGKLTVYWRPALGATGYNIYRGTTSGGESYQSPVNGGTPWDTPSYTGSATFAFTDTGLTFGQQYFYTVKAVRNGVESAPSYEDSDIPDSDGIPWDSGNASSVIAAVETVVGVTADVVAALGPDGTVYSSQQGVLRPGGSVDLGTIQPGGNVLQFSNGSSVALTDDGDLLGDGSGTSGVQIMSVPTQKQNNADGPYRRVRSQPTYTGSCGSFCPGWENQIYMSLGALKDTYYTYLGSRSQPVTNGPVQEIDAGLQWSGAYNMYNPYLFPKLKRSDGDLIERIVRANTAADEVRHVPLRHYQHDLCSPAVPSFAGQLGSSLHRWV